MTSSIAPGVRISGTIEFHQLTLFTEALQGLYIIPRSPSPVPLEERDVDTLSMEELRELARRTKQEMLAMKQIKTEVKRERADDDDAGDEDDIEIHASRPVKRRMMGAIDLTND